MVKKLSQLVEGLQGKELGTLVVAAGEDPHTIEAVNRAVDEKIVKAILVGDSDKVKEIAEAHNIDPSKFSLIDVKDKKEAVKRAVSMVRSGEGDVLMKGLVDTAVYMRAILNKEWGLLPEGRVLSHVTVVEFPSFHKLLIVSDVAVIIQPDINQKVAMLNYCIEVAHALGIEQPKAAIISAIEKVNPKMPSSVDAAIIAKMAERGQIKGAIVDGPLALDLAVDKESAEIKGVKSPVVGDADILIFPNIETGNVFFKTATKICKGNIAAMVAGAMRPAVLTSRGDSEESKFYSIALAIRVALYQQGKSLS
ncbi:MAG: phosphate butyryltransferase [Candidatus Hydrothermota bacterium]|nr:MAG: phosphate butyryltransferase [Candidatus Hydrothermae bacterium]